MKKVILLFLGGLILFSGCSKNKNDNNIKDSFVKEYEKKENYLVKGTMDIISNEDTFTYNVEAAKNKDLYRVNLVNTINNHEQVILKNSEGVYVVTPSLNKSFKFQSEWPDNGSQGYLIDSLVKDIKNDSESTSSKDGDDYVILTKVNYPNNANLVKEKIYVDSKNNLKKVEVLDSSDVVKITV